MRAVPRDRREPGRKFLRVTRSPARFPRFDKRVLHRVLSFFAALQNAVGDGKQWATHRSDQDFESLAITLNGGSVDLIVGWVHCGDHQPRRARIEIRAKNFSRALD